VLWLMAAARREERRHLSFDVLRLFSSKKFDGQHYCRTGDIAEMQRHPLPDNPLIHEAIERIEKQRMEKANVAVRHRSG
jgi:hypothetical protein